MKEAEIEAATKNAYATGWHNGEKAGAEGIEALAQEIEALRNQNAALDAECGRAWHSYTLAFNQATANGEEAQALRGLLREAREFVRVSLNFSTNDVVKRSARDAVLSRIDSKLSEG